MKQSMPVSPFSTALSGSARAAEGRIRNVFQKNKKRPPVWLMALCAAACLLCPSLVSCQVVQPPPVSRPEGPAVSLPGPGENAAMLDTALAVPEGGGAEEAKLPLFELTREDFPKQPLDFYDCPANSESWNELVWLLQEDEESDTALYGVLRFEDPHVYITNAAQALYGVILRCGENWRFLPLDWSADLWACQAPDLWLGDFDGDGQQEAAVALAWDRGSSYWWQEHLYLFELDTLEYAAPELSPLGLEAWYDGENSLLTVSTGSEQLTLDENWVAGAPIKEGRLLGGNHISFSFHRGQLRAEIWFWPEQAPLSNPFLVEYPVVLEDGAYRLGRPQFAAGGLLFEDWSIDSYRWTDEKGQIREARSQKEYDAAFAPALTVSGDKAVYGGGWLGFALELPADWADQLAFRPLRAEAPSWVEGVSITHRETLEREGEGHGALWFVRSYPKSWGTEEQMTAGAGQSVIALRTEDYTVVVHTPSDVQFSETDQALAGRYLALSAQLDVLVSGIRPK